MMMGCENPLELRKEINQLELFPQRVLSLSNHTREQRLTHRSLQTTGHCCLAWSAEQLSAKYCDKSRIYDQADWALENLDSAHVVRFLLTSLDSTGSAKGC